MLNITPLQPLFAARIEGIDAAREVPAPIMAALRDALDRYAVLVLPGQAPKVWSGPNSTESPPCRLKL